MITVEFNLPKVLQINNTEILTLQMPEENNIQESENITIQYYETSDDTKAFKKWLNFWRNLIDIES